jgi:hypothetical protein
MMINAKQPILHIYDVTQSKRYTNKNASFLLRHERIYNYHNDAFLQISKNTQIRK